MIGQWRSIRKRVFYIKKYPENGTVRVRLEETSDFERSCYTEINPAVSFWESRSEASVLAENEHSEVWCLVPLGRSRARACFRERIQRGLCFVFFWKEASSKRTRTAVRPEPSESVLSKRMQWAFNVIFLENRQQKCFRTDSNRHYRRRRPGLYPLSYGSIEKSIKQNSGICNRTKNLSLGIFNKFNK